MNDQINHYRVKLGAVHLHAVLTGEATQALERLRADDPIWTRSSVELRASRLIDQWFGPFPRKDGIKLWLAEQED